MASRDLIDTAARAMASLRREPQGAPLGGVCQGVATRTGVDVSLIRVATVVLALSGGVGAAVYASGWLLIPSAGRGDVPLARVLPPAQNWDEHTRLAITAVITAAVWLLIGSWTPFGLTPALVIAGVVLIDRHRRTRATGAPRTRVVAEGDSSGFSSAVSAWQQRLDHVSETGPAVAEGPVSRRPAGEPPPPIARTSALDDTMRPGGEAPLTQPAPAPVASRSRSPLVPLLILALALAVGAGVRSLPTGLDPRHQLMVALAVSLGVLGTGLVVAGLTGSRARSVVPVGVALCLALAALGSGLVNSHLVWTPSQGGIGTAESPITYSGMQGRFAVSPADAGATIHLDARASDVTVVIPESMTAVIDYSIRYSDFTVADRRVAGFGRDQLTLPATTAGSLPTDPGARVTLVVTATMSRVVIVHG